MSNYTDSAFQKCIDPQCAAEFDCAEPMFKCPKCGELLDIIYRWDKLEVPVKKILAGIPVEKAVNIDSMSNPESIDYFIKFASKLQEK